MGHCSAIQALVERSKVKFKMDYLQTQSIDASSEACELDRFLDKVDTLHGAVRALVVMTLHAAGAAMMVKALSTGRYVFVNEAAAQLFGRTVEQLKGASDSDLMGADDAAVMRRAEQAAQVKRVQSIVEHRLDLDGAKRDFSVSRLFAGDEYVFSVWIDRTRERYQQGQIRRALDQLEQQQAANELMRRELQQHSEHDLETGLYLRTQFDDQLRREVDLSSREHREFALVLIRLDPIKSGVASEKARRNQIEALGRLLRDNTRAMDAACRVGDDEFAVLLSGVGLATAHARMEQLRRRCVSQIVACDGEDLGISVAMGVASFPHTASSQEDLTRASQAALADAQQRGGNQVALATISFESK